MNIKIIEEPATLAEVIALAKEIYGDMVKGVADVERGVIALGGEWHMDANKILLASGSEQSNVWGFNVYTGEHGDSAVEYISLINIRPAQGNREMEIADPNIKEKILAIVKRLIPDLFV